MVALDSGARRPPRNRSDDPNPAQVAIASGSIAITDWTEGEGVVALIRVVFLVSAPIGAVALSLSFFPPEGYLAWVRGGSSSKGERLEKA